jgi:hypothetical protein
MYEEQNIGPDVWTTPVQIAGYLNLMDDRPWASMGRYGITPYVIVTMLADFDIHTARPTTREERKRGNGYKRAQFEEAWQRYVNDGDTQH